MKRRQISRRSLFFGVSMGSVINPLHARPRAGRGPAPKGKSEVRNILFIVGDDQSADALGCYGNVLVRTPNLDCLAVEGAIFKHAYTNSPVCTPSRQSIITGKLPHAVGVTLLSTPLSPAQETIAEHLQKFGYETGAVGKMHFNSNLKHGFDFRVDLPDFQQHWKENPPRKPPQDVPVRPPWRPFKDPARIWLNADRLPSSLYDAESEGTYFARRACEFLRANREKRFCLWVSFYEPHSPFNFPIEYAGRYDPLRVLLPAVGAEDIRWIPAVFKGLSDEDKRGIIASYYTSVEYQDKNIGLVLDELDRLGLEDTTLVIYVGDNGYLLADHGRFEKHTMWEPAVRVPLIVRDPLSGPRKPISALVEFVDLAPTILERLRVPPMIGLQGRSLVPLLAGKTRKHRDHVFSEFLPDNMAMVRTERWKYIFTSGKNDLAMGYATGNPPPGITHLLYDLENDPKETINRGGDPRYNAILKKLQRMMLARFESTHPRAKNLPAGLSVEEALAWFCEPPDPESGRKAPE